MSTSNIQDRTKKVLYEWSKGACHSDKYEGDFIVDTLEGALKADVRDFIVKGVNGEFYPVKPDIFCKTYETTREIKLVLDE